MYSAKVKQPLDRHQGHGCEVPSEGRDAERPSSRTSRARSGRGEAQVPRSAADQGAAEGDDRHAGGWEVTLSAASEERSKDRARSMRLPMAETRFFEALLTMRPIEATASGSPPPRGRTAVGLDCPLALSIAVEHGGAALVEVARTSSSLPNSAHLALAFDRAFRHQRIEAEFAQGGAATSSISAARRSPWLAMRSKLYSATCSQSSAGIIVLQRVGDLVDDAGARARRGSIRASAPRCP